MFATLENVSGDEDINRAWESIKENIKTSVKESLKQRAYLKVKIEELETNSKIKNIRDLSSDINDSRRVTSLDLI
jgi:RNA-binding protein YhbY